MAEFRAILEDPEKLNAINQAVFNQIDADKSGSIDKKELTNAMSMIAIQAEVSTPTPEHVETAFKELDVNQDGIIDLEEFKSLMRQMLETLANS